MATILISDCDLLDLLSAPFNATTDFTVPPTTAPASPKP